MAVAQGKVVYACGHCGTQHPKWQGQCGDCGKWNTLTEEALPGKSSIATSRSAPNHISNQITSLVDVELADAVRLSTGLTELDHVLGGGLVSDSMVLIGGDPGIGKSTLLIQVLDYLSQQHTTLYVTGEESLQQVAMRATRLGLKKTGLNVLAETSVERILQQAEKTKPAVIIIDSIQTVFTERLSSAPGTVSQVRESAAQLLSYGKQKGVVLLLVGHVTKEGALAGPRVLEHMVDAVLYFEGQGDSRFRAIRAVKNRFGAVNELGVFAMTDKGLREVAHPSAIFLSRSKQPMPGGVVLVTWEGTRPLLVEVQALVDESHLSNPRRVTVGLEQNRLAILLAVLNRHGGVRSHDQDVFINVVGGLRITETGADLAQVLAVLSSLKNKPLSMDLVVFGEIGLSGEIRPVPGGQERLREAVKHGFKLAVVPKANVPKKRLPGLEIIGVANLAELLAAEIV